MGDTVLNGYHFMGVKKEEMTKNELEMSELFRQLPEREQLAKRNPRDWYSLGFHYLTLCSF